MKDLMIDIETLDTANSAVVLSIGAVFFDLEKGTISGDQFYETLNIQDQIDKGRTISASTLMWWMNQESDAKKVFDDHQIKPEFALSRLIDFMARHSTEYGIPISKMYVYGNGSMFDISIIEDLFKTYNQTILWHFSRIMDLRTFKRFVANNAKIEPYGTKHNALNDAVAQAMYMIKYYKKESSNETT